MVDSGATQPRDVPGHDPATESERVSAVVSDPLPREALDLNVDGRQVMGPDNGFGKLWHKRYWIRLPASAVSPEALIETWKARYSEFWPEGSRLYQPPDGLDPGDVAAADLAMIGGTRIGTGIVVADAGDTSFTFATLKGHTLAGTITFTGRHEDNATVAQVEVIMRAGDPLYEIGMPLGGHQHENKFWQASLVALGHHFGVEAQPEKSIECLDNRRKWRNASNITHNAFLHTAAYLVMRQFRRLTGSQSAKGNSS